VAGKGTPASPKKTLPQREAELRTMLATAEGRADLEALAARYIDPVYWSQVLREEQEAHLD